MQVLLYAFHAKLLVCLPESSLVVQWMADNVWEQLEFAILIIVLVETRYSLVHDHW